MKVLNVSKDLIIQDFSNSTPIANFSISSIELTLFNITCFIVNGIEITLAINMSEASNQTFTLNVSQLQAFCEGDYLYVQTFLGTSTIIDHWNMTIQNLTALINLNLSSQITPALSYLPSVVLNNSVTTIGNLILNLNGSLV